MKIHRTRIEDREAGLSMPEIMLGLSVLAIVAAAGITAYNNVQPRVRANTLYSGLQGFMVDAAQYLSQYHSEENEAALTNNASNRKTFDTTTDAGVDTHHRHLLDDHPMPQRKHHRYRNRAQPQHAAVGLATVAPVWRRCIR